MTAHQHEVHEQRVHRRVADALTDANRGAVEPRGSGVERRQRVDHRKVTIPVAVPVDPDAAAAVGDHAVNESHDSGRTRPGLHDRRCRTHTRVTPRRGWPWVQLAQGVRICPGRVLGDVHDRESFPNGERDRLFGEPEQLIERPPFGVLAQAGSTR